MKRIARFPILLLLCIPLVALAQTKETCPLDVYDVVPPEIVCPADTTVQADSTGVAYLGDFTPLLAVDECSVSPSLMQSPVACTILKVPNETTIVSLVAIDDNHNAAACSFKVTLKKPTALVPPKSEEGM